MSEEQSEDWVVDMGAGDIDGDGVTEVVFGLADNTVVVHKLLFRFSSP